MQPRVPWLHDKLPGQPPWPIRSRPQSATSRPQPSRSQPASARPRSAQPAQRTADAAVAVDSDRVEYVPKRNKAVGQRRPNSACVGYSQSAASVGSKGSARGRPVSAGSARRATPEDRSMYSGSAAAALRLRNSRLLSRCTCQHALSSALNQRRLPGSLLCASWCSRGLQLAGTTHIRQ